MGAGKARVQRHRPFEMDPGACIVGRREAIKMMQAQMVVCPGIQRFQRADLCDICLVERNVDFEC